MPFICERISSAVPASSVTTSLPAGDAAWTTAPGSAAMRSDTPWTRFGVECTTRLVMCNSADIASAAGRTGNELVHPDDETVAGNENDGQHRRHDNGKE